MLKASQRANLNAAEKEPESEIDGSADAVVMGKRTELLRHDVVAESAHVAAGVVAVCEQIVHVCPGENDPMPACLLRRLASNVSVIELGQCTQSGVMSFTSSKDLDGIVFVQLITTKEDIKDIGRCSLFFLVGGKQIEFTVTFDRGNASFFFIMNGIKSESTIFHICADATDPKRLKTVLAHFTTMIVPLLQELGLELTLGWPMLVKRRILAEILRPSQSTTAET
ncbi:MAG: hypothetical protein HY817_04015 [Candidatus Abawacabacteria bacterium]|nr:hypothetical protein [Candidatus Abawacabacteria bacterium]